MPCRCDGQSVACTALRVTVSFAPGRGPASGDDGVNVIGTHDEAWCTAAATAASSCASPSELALTSVFARRNEGQITGADIQAGLKLYNVTLREGDIVIVHTGWGDLFAQYPAKNAEYNSGEPGIGKDAAKYLIDQKIVAVGCDQWACEVIPGEDPKEAFIVHNMLITDSGIHIIENVRTDLMAEEAARTGRATFFFNVRRNEET